MAGQPPEPSFQPTGQDQALTQGRPAWQQPTYPPPAAPPGGQQGYPAPSFTPPDQAYAPQDQGYPQQDQGYAAQDQGYAQQGQGYTSLGQAPGQDYQAYQPPSYGAQPGPGQGAGAPQWQGIAGVTPATPRSKQRGEKGFLGSLFDFSFTSMVTPKIIRVLYGLAVAWTVLFALAYVVVGFSFGGLGGGIAVLVLVVPIMLLLGIGISRVILEGFMVAFRIHDELKEIRKQGENRA
jgi:hypothetical protein